MIKNLHPFKIISTLALWALTALAGADILRCEAGSGEVTYTDTDCGDHPKTTTLLFVENQPVKNATYQQPLQTAQGRSRSWANMYIAPRARKVDVESVRSARSRMMAMDGSSRDLVIRK